MSSQNQSKWKDRLIFLFLGYIITQISPPLFADIYNSTLKKWIFERRAIITLNVTSTTTLSPLNEYENNKYFYEITSFKITNTGKKLGEDTKLKIEARGKIIGITPDTLNSFIEVNKNDPSHALLKIGKLEPDDQLKGEIHSFATISNDRNKSAIGFDSDNNYKLLIKAE